MRLKKRWFEAAPTASVPAQVLGASPLLDVDRGAIVAGAREILDARLWCVVEVCLDVPRQKWERRLVIFRRDPDAVADAVAEWVESMPHADARLSGCTRTSLRTVAGAPTCLCYVADVPA
ncbi:MAG TPA: hypothetical protein VHA76_11400 [Solirubrobacterales bacterium]|nr:hypothetical protein [Solirubrobacterales bacterium]